MNAYQGLALFGRSSKNRKCSLVGEGIALLEEVALLVVGPCQGQSFSLLPTDQDVSSWLRLQLLVCCCHCLKIIPVFIVGFVLYKSCLGHGVSPQQQNTSQDESWYLALCPAVTGLNMLSVGGLEDIGALD